MGVREHVNQKAADGQADGGRLGNRRLVTIRRLWRNIRCTQGGTPARDAHESGEISHNIM